MYFLGSDFLKKTGSKSSPVKQSYENRDQMEYLSHPYEYETRISNNQSDCLMQEYHPGGSDSYNKEGEVCPEIHASQMTGIMMISLRMTMLIR